MKLNSPAKINIFLDVLGKEQSGYHKILTVFQAIDLFDEIEIEEAEENIINVYPENLIKGENIISKVFEKLKNFTDKKFKVIIKKHIPIGAGLGGGSSNAASVLLGIKKFLNLEIDEYTILKEIGSDCSFFIKAGCQIGRNYGEVLEKLNIDFDYNIVLVYPDIVISTAKIYSMLNFEFFKEGESKFKDLIDSVNKKDIEKFFHSFYNVFEKIVFENYPKVKDINDFLLKEKANAALMSGTGSAVYGVFLKRKEAEKVYNKIKKFYNNVWLCKPVY